VKTINPNPKSTKNTEPRKSNPKEKEIAAEPFMTKRYEGRGIVHKEQVRVCWMRRFVNIKGVQATKVLR